MYCCPHRIKSVKCVVYSRSLLWFVAGFLLCLSLSSSVFCWNKWLLSWTSSQLAVVGSVVLIVSNYCHCLQWQQIFDFYFLEQGHTFFNNIFLPLSFFDGVCVVWLCAFHCIICGDVLLWNLYFFVSSQSCWREFEMSNTSKSVFLLQHTPLFIVLF